MIDEFFKRLIRQRVSGATVGVKGKIYSAQARAQSKASSAFNKAIDKPIDKVKAGAKGAAEKAKGKVQGNAGGHAGSKAAAPAQKKDEGSMGLFGKKKGGEGAAPQPAPEAEPEFGEKTQFIQVVQERPKECVGWVVALNGPLKGLDFRLVTGKNVIGTAADTDIVLTDQYMSARHAVIRHEEGTFVLVDLDSTNGTFVNDTRCSKEELIDNDRIRLGRTELKFKSLY